MKSFLTPIFFIVFSYGLNAQVNSVELSLSSNNVSDIASQSSGLFYWGQTPILKTNYPEVFE